jgi:hypothetical protein
LNNSYKIVTTKVFIQSLARFEEFLTRKYSKTLSREQVTKIKRQINKKLIDNPHLAPPSQRLLPLGIYQCRQWSLDDHNIVFYRVDEDSKKIILLVAMDSRQSIEKLLYELMLLS